MTQINIAHDTPLLPLPTDTETLARCLADPYWRVFSGCLYKIMIKGDGDEETQDVSVMPFKPNAAQEKFVNRLWHRNVILKARQLGFTTLIAILWLDHALFNADQRCGIIAQDREAAEVIFRDKVKFAYENLPEQIRERFPLARDSASELLFAHNNSSIRVATSMRSGTIHRLHISEFGKICAKFPDKAKEVMTGSIPAVPSNGILVIESTAEGRDGSFFKICQTAQANFAQRKKLNFRDYRFHFYAWWQEPKYRMDSSMVSISPEQHEYFDEVETIVERDMGITVKIDVDQRAWYVATIEADFEGADDRMWQEYPSYSAEAFQVSTDGNYYAKDMALLRKRGGITNVPELDMPVNTFWDIGNSDGCAIWFHQDSNGQDRFLDYYEAHGETLKHYVAKLREKGYVFDTHYLPHDATHERLSDFNKSTLQMLQDLMPGERFVVVPRISYLMDGIQQTRACMRNYYFDQTNCKLGIDRLDGYKKRWNNAESRYVDQPDKSNGCSEGADALRQHAQAKMAGLIVSSTKTAGSDYEEDNDNDWRTM
nr:terminase [Moraxella sp.]